MENATKSQTIRPNPSLPSAVASAARSVSVAATQSQPSRTWRRDAAEMIHCYNNIYEYIYKYYICSYN